MKRIFFKWLALVVAAHVGCGAAVARAEELAQAEDGDLRPVFSGRGGILTFAEHHNFYVETQWEYPFLWEDRLYLSLGQRNVTPFLDTGGILGAEFQVELVHATTTLRTEWEIGRNLALKWLHRHERTLASDRPGEIQSYEMGFGLGTPEHYRNSDRVRWELTAGPVVKIEGLDADWFLLARGSWDVVRGRAPEWTPNLRRLGLSLDANVESVNNGSDFQPLVEAGPSLRLPTVGGSQADLFAHWLANFDNPFSFERDKGLLIGLQIDSWGEPQWGHDALDFESGRVLPSAWARYDAGFWTTHHVTTLEARLELFEFALGSLPLTSTLWYQHRQEFREGNFDHTNYTVALGAQTPVTLPLVSPVLARGEPVVVGADFLHRSDHSLDPPVSRLTAPPVTRVTPLGTFLAHSNVNIWRVRVQSLGWEEPYRYKEHFDEITRWLGVLDWRVTAGFAEQNSRRRSKAAGGFACQVAANVDIATVRGVVAYAQGAYSIQQETPEYYAEVGLKRPTFRVFWRAEDFAAIATASRGGVFYLGFGVNL